MPYSTRNGSNFLEIEKGRWTHVPVELRLCKQCDGKVVENEIHFILSCPRYNSLRQKLFSIILDISQGKWDLEKVDTKDCFLILMNGTGDEFEKTIFLTFQKYLVKFKNARIVE